MSQDVCAHGSRLFWNGVGFFQDSTLTPLEIGYKSNEILMLVCLQKDAKQCCDATKLDCTPCVGTKRGQTML